eukprot:1944820-Amphidinium_carterae.1
MARVVRWDGEASSSHDFPGCSRAYFHQIVKSQNPGMSLRSSMEILTLSAALDMIAANQIENLSDLLAQRMKAVEKAVAENSWERA